MALRYTGTFKDDSGVQYWIKIHDDNFSGTAGEFTCGSEGFVLKYDGDTRDTHDPIITSSVEFTFIAQNTDDDDFFSDLADATDESIQIAIYRYAEPTLWWAGTLLTEQVEIVDEYYPYAVKLVATDGLGHLSNKLYNDAGSPYTPGFQDFATIVLNCLNRTGTSDFWGVQFDSVYLKFADHIKPSNTSESDEFLSYAQVHTSTFIKEDEQNDARFYDCMTVLRSVCVTWNMRLFQAYGRWWLVPVGAYIGSGTSMTFHGRKKTGVLAVDTTIGTTINPNQIESATRKRLKGWTRGYLVPTKEVTRTQEFNGNVPLFYRFSASASDFPLTMSDVDRSYVTGNAFRIQANTQYIQSAASLSGNARARRVELQLTIKSGTRYYKRATTYTNQVLDFHLVTGSAIEYTAHTYGTAQWTTNSADTYNIVSQVFDANTDITENTAIEIPCNLVTLPLPDDQDHLDVTFTWKLIDNTGSATALSTGVSATYIRADIDGDPGDKITWKATNDLNATYKYNQGTVLFGDEVTAGGRGQIKVFASTTYVPATSWTTPQNLTGLPLHELGLRSVVRMTKKAFETVSGRIRGQPFYPYQTFTLDSIVYLPFSVSYVAQTLENDVQMFRVGYETAGSVDNSDEGIKDVSPPPTPTVQNSSTQAFVDQLKDQIDGIADGLQDIQDDVETNTTAISTLDGSVSANQTSITSNDTDIDNLQRVLKGDGGTDLGVFSDTGDVTASGLVVQSTETKIQGGDNTAVSASQSSPGTIEMAVQAWTGVAGSENSVTAVTITGSSSVNTKATINFQGGDARFTNTPVQFNSGSTVNFLGTTSGISHDDLDDKPPLYHGVLLDGAGGGDLVGSGSISFAVNDTLSHTGSGVEGIWQCTTATTITRAASESSAVANWTASASNFIKVASPGDLSLADLDPSSGSDTFSDTLQSFSLTTTGGLTLSGGAGVIAIGTVTNIGAFTSTGTVTGANLTTSGTLTSGDINLYTHSGELNVGGNTYAFRYHTGSASTLYGVFFNASTADIETRNSAGAQVHAVNANSGRVRINNSYNLPTSDGSSGQVLTTDGSGNVTFQTPSGGGSSTHKVILNYGFFDSNVRNIFIPLTNETETTSRQRYNVYVPTSAGEVTKFSLFLTGSKSGGTGGSVAVQKMTGATSYVTLATATFSSVTGYVPQVLTFSGATFSAGDRIYFWVVNGFGSSWGNMMGSIEIELS